MDLWNVGILPQPYTVSQNRRFRLESLTCADVKNVNEGITDISPLRKMEFHPEVVAK
jgi:hypothetical protein